MINIIRLAFIIGSWAFAASLAAADKELGNLFTSAEQRKMLQAISVDFKHSSQQFATESASFIYHGYLTTPNKKQIYFINQQPHANKKLLDHNRQIKPGETWQQQQIVQPFKGEVKQHD